MRRRRAVKEAQDGVRRARLAGRGPYAILPARCRPRKDTGQAQEAISTSNWKIISTGMGSNQPKPRGKGATGSELKCINTGSGRYQDRP